MVGGAAGGVPKRIGAGLRYFPRSDDGIGKRHDRISARRFFLFALLLWLSGALLPAPIAAGHNAQHRYLSEQKNRTQVPAQYAPLTFADFLALPTRPGGITAADWEGVLARTPRAVSLEGYIAEVIPAPDGDFHVHLRERRQPGCFPEGPRGEQLVTEVTPAFQPPATGWSLAGLRSLCERQARVRISGWLLYDYPHARDIGHWRASAWEIHPVTRMEVWEPERQAWQRLP